MMKAKGKIKLGTILYSLTNEFHGREYTFEQLVRKVSELDLGPGLEVVGLQSIRTFPQVSEEYCSWFRGLLDECELEPVCLSLNADVNIRRGAPMTHGQIVESQAEQLRTAAKLGFRLARVQGYICGPEVYEDLLPLAEKLDVKMGIEIHAPHRVDDPQIMAYREAFDRLDSPFLGWIPDFSTSASAVPSTYVQAIRDAGVPEDIIQEALSIWETDDMPAASRSKRLAEWRDSGVPIGGVGLMGRMFGMFGRQPIEAWKEIMPRVIHVHGKFYDIDANGETTAIDFRKLLPLFVEAGYEGYISSEWEGHVFTDDSGFDNLVKQQKLTVSILNSLH